jgi:hypothetical protein
VRFFISKVFSSSQLFFAAFVQYVPPRFGKILRARFRRYAPTSTSQETNFPGDAQWQIVGAAGRRTPRSVRYLQS